LLIGAYSELDGWAGWDAGSPFFSPGSNWIYGDMAADDAHKGSDPGDPSPLIFFEMHEGLNSGNEYLQGKWSAAYDGVSRANDVLRILKLARQEKKIDENLGVQIEAEARFLRAYYHLEAIKIWDFVPYVDENEEDGIVPNKPASSVMQGGANLPWSQLEGDGDIPWEKTEADFRFAIDHLPESPRNGEVGRATKYAALGLTARVLLYQGRFDEALPLLNEIINSGKYSLPDRYDENFKTSGDNNSESIFQIQASVNDGDPEGSNGNYGEILNFPYNGGPAKCCGFNQPSQDLVNAFKTLNGLPYLKYFGLEYNAEGDDVINDMGRKSSDPFVPDPRPLDPRLDWTVGRRGIPYLDWGDHPGNDWFRNQSFGGPYSPKKMVYYKREEGINSLQGGWTSGLTANNYSILRYADVLLMAAECETETGSLSNARELVNEVRARASHTEGFVYKSDSITPAANYEISIYPTSGPEDPFQTQAGSREAVRFERRIELGLEGLRFWDLKRWGVLKKTLDEYYKNEANTIMYIYPDLKFDDQDVRYPIPQIAIDKSEKTLSQNPGYSPL
jgi:tetratricopeptide (TPR) repeat protein